MRVTKFGHACLLIEEGNTKVLVDPGIWNKEPEATGINAILITHEHQDHAFPAQIKNILGRNPEAKIYTHAAVAAILEKEGIAAERVEPNAPFTVGDFTIESVGTEHAVIYGASPCRNTGFLINDLFVPGDALHDVPSKPVRVLALPTGGPWMKIAEAIDYVKKVNPKIILPVHDAMYTEEFRSGLIPRVTTSYLPGIEFVDMPAGATHEF